MPYFSDAEVRRIAETQRVLSIVVVVLPLPGGDHANNPIPVEPRAVVESYGTGEKTRSGCPVLQSEEPKKHHAPDVKNSTTLTLDKV